MKRTFRICAVIAGLVERRHPGRVKSGRQVTVSTDLIYDVLRKHDPRHILLEAAWADAATGLLDLGRLGDFLRRTKGHIRPVVLPRVTPLAVPLLLDIGREMVYGGSAGDDVLREAAEILIREATIGAVDAGRPPAAAAALRAARFLCASAARTWWPIVPEQLYWTDCDTLLVADLHLEKGSACAERGVFLPPYDTRDTLERLARVLSHYDPARVIVLGDGFHSTPAASKPGPANARFAQQASAWAQVDLGRRQSRSRRSRASRRKVCSM